MARTPPDKTSHAAPVAGRAVVRRLGWLALALGLALTAGCPSADLTGPGGPTDDGGTDLVFDLGPGDVGDAGEPGDVERDTPDAAADSASDDGSSDTTGDPLADVTKDDTAPDGEADAAHDAAPDTAPDAEDDTASDLGPDAPPEDATPDADTDGGGGGPFTVQFAPTAGFGELASGPFTVRLFVGAPQPQGPAAGSGYRVTFGPAVGPFEEASE